MLFKPSMRKILEARGYHHCKSDEEFTRHGDYARNIQYVFSKEFKTPEGRVVDLVYLGVDVLSEKLVIGFFRENVSLENGVMENSDVRIPLASFSMKEFEKQVDRVIPKGDPQRKPDKSRTTF